MLKINECFFSPFHHKCQSKYCLIIDDKEKYMESFNNETFGNFHQYA